MGYYVALAPWDSNKTLNELEFNKGAFWIQAHDLPLGMLTSTYATELATSLGKLIELDCIGEGPQTDRDFLQFRVEIDITKPLVPGLFITRLDGKEFGGSKWRALVLSSLTYFFSDDSLFFLKASNDECRALVSILNSYCKASGQTVNFGKSSAFFSPNTPASLRNDICSALQVHQMDSNAKYLGLPSIFGQCKTELFGFLLDKVLQKLQGWKQKVLSQAGREVLIKSVIQAIPTYAMQCFLLPVSDGKLVTGKTFHSGHKSGRENGI
ncbi:hypothetical protein CTI12_AA426470 [Artemisia annua]|uniref:Uncharacterized protein n=1 Tax=Artemisia annua TaxID=35608 RepID=A0A2U1M2S9_ARTAN|nr:hypothetical protein CTI12_AA426470 [Artemisia annua]